MKLFTGLLVAFAFASKATALEAEATSLIIDNFSSRDGKSSFGTYWQILSDNVMGGISKGRAYLIPSQEGAERFVLKMMGDVSLENNGGFIQVRLPMVRQN